MLRQNLTKGSEYFGSPERKAKLFTAPSPMPSCAPLPSASSSNISCNAQGLSPLGIRGAVQGFLKATVLLRDDLHHAYDKNGSYLPEPSNHDQILEKQSATAKLQRLTEADILMVVSDTDQFHKIQDALRARHSQTDAMVKQIGGDLIRECLAEMRKTHAADEAIRRQEQRQLSIAKELTEARIKAQQALKIESPVKERPESDSFGGSPSSVAAIVNMDSQQLGTFKPGMQFDDDSQDGDIQEVEEE